MRSTRLDDPLARPGTPHSASRTPQVFLEIRRGAARHRLRPVLGPVFLIGRSEECDLVLADEQIPDMHAYLLVGEGRVSLRHLGEGPEITVDGRPVEAVELLHGDRLRTGPYEFRVHLGGVPGGDGGKEQEQVAPAAHSATNGAARHPHDTPLEIVRALVADVRARLEAPNAANPQRGAA